MPRRRVERNISYDEERKLYYVNLDYGLDPQTGKQVKKTVPSPKSGRPDLRSGNTSQHVSRDGL